MTDSRGRYHNCALASHCTIRDTTLTLQTISIFITRCYSRFSLTHNYAFPNCSVVKLYDIIEETSCNILFNDNSTKVSFRVFIIVIYKCVEIVTPLSCIGNYVVFMRVD